MRQYIYLPTAAHNCETKIGLSTLIQLFHAQFTNVSEFPLDETLSVFRHLFFGFLTLCKPISITFLVTVVALLHDRASRLSLTYLVN